MQKSLVKMPHLCVSEAFSFRNLLMVLDGSKDNYSIYSILAVPNCSG